jgi:hypothetical protein
VSGKIHADDAVAPNVGASTVEVVADTDVLEDMEGVQSLVAFWTLAV